ncbi:MAG: transketolase C-terminal domain-containing protein [Thalassobaculales bacterium]
MRKTSLDGVLDLARRDPRVVFIGSDLGAGTLAEFKREMPERFFMEGVAEQHIIGMAAGLAMDGFVPYVNTIATFLTRRCLEQVAVDLCLHNLPVRLIANGGGVVYAPLGPTHLAIEDIALLRALPNMSIFAPCDAAEMSRLIPATLDLPGPAYIRLAKGGDPVVSDATHGFAIGKAILMRPPGRMLLVSTGIMTQRALALAEEFDAGVLHVHTLKPLDGDAIRRLAGEVELVATLEEHTLIGGLGAAVASLLLSDPPARMPRLLQFGLPDSFPAVYGGQDDILAAAGLDVPSLAGRLRAARGGGHG